MDYKIKKTGLLCKIIKGNLSWKLFAILRNWISVVVPNRWCKNCDRKPQNEEENNIMQKQTYQNKMSVKHGNIQEHNYDFLSEGCSTVTPFKNVKFQSFAWA